MIYVFAIFIIVLINVVPAFMPPTWTIVSYFYIKYELNLLLLSFLGAISSSFGRFLLTKLSSKTAPLVLSKVMLENLKHVSSKIKGHPARIFLFTFLWAISPIASNPLFISMGLARTNLKYALSGFFIGRILSYFFLGFTSKIVVESLEDIIHVFSFEKLLINFLSILIIVLYLVIDWKSLFIDKKFKLISFKS